MYDEEKSLKAFPDHSFLPASYDAVLCFGRFPGLFLLLRADFMAFPSGLCRTVARFYKIVKGIHSSGYCPGF